MDEKLFITGVNGLIGQILIPSFAESYDVCGVDTVGENSPNIRTGDISDEKQLEAIIEEFAPISYFIHLAAESSSDAPWHKVLLNNIHGTWNVFSLASRYGVKRIIFASSNHTTGYYEGVPPQLHLQENPAAISISDPVRPDGPYGISKVVGEAIARYFFDSSGLEAICLRIGSVLDDDDPTKNVRYLSTWLSHQDLITIFHRSLAASDNFPGFGIYYGVSNNSNRFWDISNAEKELEFTPRDNAAGI